MKATLFRTGILALILIGSQIIAALPVSALPQFAPLEIDIHLAGVPFANRMFSGDIHCLVDRAVDDLRRIRISAPSLKLGDEAVANVQGEFLMNVRDGTLVIKKLEIGKIQLNGKISLNRRKLDLSCEFKELPIEYLFAVFSGGSILSGEAESKIRIQGTWNAPLCKGYVQVHDGMLKGFPFSEAFFNFLGNYPNFILSNSYIKNDDGQYALEGVIGIDDLAGAEKINLRVSPEKLVIDGWSVSRNKGEGLNFSKDDGSAFSLGYDPEPESPGDSKEVDLEFKKALGIETFLKLKVRNSGSGLFVGRQVEF